MTLKGLDEAWGKVDPATAKALGYDFIVGYVSEDPTKNLTASDIVRIHAAGMAVAFVYEYNPMSALGGYASGVSNATVASGLFKTLGVPTGVACYNAGTDFNVLPGQMSTCLAHETGFSVTMATQGYRSGAYTGYPFGNYLTQHNYSGFIWQTYAWSNGAWLAAAALRQIQNGVHVAGIDVDIDESQTVDFGQWESGIVTDFSKQDPNAWAQAVRVEAMALLKDQDQNGEAMPFTAAIKALLAAAQGSSASVLTDADRALIQSFVDSVNALTAHLK